MDDLWPNLVTSAILGTERRPLALPAAGGALGALLARLDAADPAGQLLGAAVATALFRQAARMPLQAGEPSPPPAPAEDLPVCPPQAAQHLAAMLGGPQRALLPEWLALLAQQGMRAPPALLPNLLELGRTNAELRRAVLPALGARGRWLAAYNPAWAYARAAAPQAGGEQLAHQWDTGARAERLALLARQREEAPGLARELLARSWAAERAEDRAAFVASLEAGLSLEDEPLLEAALDDRSKDVRRAAAGLLARLPDARLARRMRERAVPLLQLAAERPRVLAGRRRGGGLIVTLPEACDAAMQRDGVEPKPPAHRQKLGEKSWWLLQIVGAVPPATWSELWDRSPAELIALAGQGEWGALLAEAWATAALAARDAAWAEALLRHSPAFAELLPLLPVARREALLLEILRGDCTPLHKHPVLELLRKAEHAWSAELARALLRALYRHMRKWRDSYDYQLRGALTDEFARRMPPALLGEIAAGLPDEPDVRERWQGVIDKLLITMQFRHDMLRALALR